MNLQSEIEYLRELRLVDKARLLACSCTSWPWRPAAPTDRAPSRCTTARTCASSTRSLHRLTRFIEQLLAEDATRPADDVVLRMLLAPRADKVAERLVFNAYARAIQGFESYDTTVIMGS